MRPALFVAAILTSHHSHALDSTSGQHLELSPVYDTGTSQWTWTAVGNQVYPLDQVFFSGRDVTSSSGTRITRPTDPKWDFMGVFAGATLWRFRDTIVGTPGFADTQGTLSANSLDFRLHSVEGPPGGHMSLYFSNTNPIVYFRSDDGIDGTDLFSKPANHTHLNWAFTKKGLWIVHLTVQGTVNSTGAPTSQSPPQPLVFAIGDYAIWKAARFNIAELQNNSVSGDSADPDGDSWNNLMEYALGGDPHVASALREGDGQPLAPLLLPPAAPGAPWQFYYFRRTAGSGSELSYAVESSSSLAQQSWTVETGTEELLSPATDWEHIRIPLETPPGTRLFRLKVASIP